LIHDLCKSVDVQGLIPDVLLQKGAQSHYSAEDLLGFVPVFNQNGKAYRSLQQVQMQLLFHNYHSYSELQTMTFFLQ